MIRQNSGVYSAILIIIPLLISYIPIAYADDAIIRARENTAPVRLRVTATDTKIGDVMWVLPGVRRLDPQVFGTPYQPLGFEPPPLGVPLEGRLTNEDGTAYTTTKDPTPFGDEARISFGNLEMVIEDYVLVDDPNSTDKVYFRCNFTSPDETLYEVYLNETIPVGFEHSFFGGVATNLIQHGYTGIGSRLVPSCYTYATFWGVGVLHVDGEKVADNRLVHVMVTGNMRDEEDRMVLTSDEINEDEIMVHVILLPTEITPDGQKPSPVPTDYILPNGVPQPFLNINFYNVNMVDLVSEDFENLKTQLETSNTEIQTLERKLSTSLTITASAIITIIAALVGIVIGYILRSQKWPPFLFPEQ